MASYLIDQIHSIVSTSEFQIVFCVTFLILIIFMSVYWKSQTATTPFDNFKSIATTVCEGSCTLDMPLASHTRFRVGGKAEIFFRPTNIYQLVTVLKMKPRQMKVTPLGMGSNVLVRDGGVLGLVVQIVGRSFAQFSIHDHDSDSNEKIVQVGAGLSQLKCAKLCAKAGISGLEFLCGIPGTIGGALRMNAGAHGSQVSDRLISAMVVDSDNGQIHNMQASELHYTYRKCELPKHWIFISGRFKGDYSVKSRDEIECTIQEMLARREATQPVNEKTAGCTFTNIVDSNCSAWTLITDAGCQGKIIGGAQVSLKHSNFLVNNNSATAEDLELLGDYVQEEVLKKSGVRLRWEVERIGVREMKS